MMKSMWGMWKHYIRCASSQGKVAEVFNTTIIVNFHDLSTFSNSISRYNVFETRHPSLYYTDTKWRKDLHYP